MNAGIIKADLKLSGGAGFALGLGLGACLDSGAQASPTRVSWPSRATREGMVVSSLGAKAMGSPEPWGMMPPASGSSLRIRRATGPEHRVDRLGGQARLTAADTARTLITRLGKIEFATDLGADIGSGKWWRGFALMLCLSGAAIAFWPSFSLPQPPAKPVERIAIDNDEGPEVAASPSLAPSAPPRDQIALMTTLADGDNFAQMFQRVGVGAQDAEQVSGLMAAAIPMGDIAPGTSFSLSLDAGGNHALQRVAFRTRSDLDVSIERRGDSLELSTTGAIAGDAPLPALNPPALSPPTPVAESAPLPVAPAFSPSASPAQLGETGPLRIRGRVGASLYRSAREAGVPAQAVQQYLQTLGAHMDITALRPDDTFDLILGPHHAGLQAGESGELLYAGLEHDGHPRTQLVRWGRGGQFFDASPRASLQPARLLMPVEGRITSGFGMRFHPILGYTRMHEGIDLSAPWGSPIHAVASGVVSYAGVHGGHGNYVRLEHSGGLGTGYAHMSRIAVASGTHVRAGQVIGYVGSSGLSTGAHLHYEVYRDGETVNPLSVHFTTGAGNGGGLPHDLSAFRARLAKLLLVKPGASLAPLGSHVASR